MAEMEILACGRNMQSSHTGWKWVDHFRQVSDIDPCDPKTPADKPRYCGRRNNNDQTYRLLCDKCLVRAGITW